MPALCVTAFTPQASNAESRIITVAQPWYSPKGRCTQTSPVSTIPREQEESTHSRR